jgi:LemA protein
VQVEEAWAQIDVQLKRRYDLIPNLIETVKGYASHEAQTFQKVTEARANAINASDPKSQAKAENMLSDALKSLFAVSESYPNLQASQNFLQMQEELSTTENKIAFARQYYNDSVQKLNTLRSTFPLLLLKNVAPAKDFFEADATEKEVPKVKF